MSLNCCRKKPTKELLTWKQDLEYEKSNWERRVREQTKNFNNMLRPIRVYKRWVKDCKKKIAVIDAVLKERGLNCEMPL